MVAISLTLALDAVLRRIYPARAWASGGGACSAILVAQAVAPLG